MVGGLLSLLTPDERHALIWHMAMIKRNALAAPFLIAFNEQKELQANFKDAAGAQQMDVQQQDNKGTLMTINYRDGEAIFIRANHDRVTVIFSTEFKEETDRVFGRVFLQVSSDVPPPLTRVGVLRRTQAAVAAECTPGDVLEPRTPSGDPPSARTAEERERRLCDVQ